MKCRQLIETLQTCAEATRMHLDHLSRRLTPEQRKNVFDDLLDGMEITASKLEHALAELQDEIEDLGGEDSMTDEEYRHKARLLYASDGEVEIDDNAVVSHGDDEGAYVQAWVWVPSQDNPTDGNPTDE